VCCNITLFHKLLYMYIVPSLLIILRFGLSLDKCCMNSFSVFHFNVLLDHCILQTRLYQPRSLHLFIYLSIVYLSIYLSIYIYIHLSVYQPVYLSIYIYICLSFYLYFHLSFYLCITPSIHQFINLYLSVY
jgi:hypothetical protein